MSYNIVFWKTDVDYKWKINLIKIWFPYIFYRV